MSLFEDKNYQYRETYFLLFKKENRPEADKIESALSELGPKYETVEVRNNDGVFEAMTVRSPYDFSAMDITYVEGPDVVAQVGDLMEAMQTTTLTGDDRKKLSKVNGADARFEIYHFEQVGDTPEGLDDNLDPGGLLLVLDKLSELCDGVGIDPSSNSLM